MCKHMATKTITIKEEAYRRLKALKRDDESFSDELIRITKAYENDFSDLIGLDVDISWEELKEDRKRDKGDERREKLFVGQ